MSSMLKSENISKQYRFGTVDNLEMKYCDEVKKELAPIAIEEETILKKDKS